METSTRNRHSQCKELQKNSPHRRDALFLLGGVILPLGVFGGIAEDVAEKEKFAFDQAGLTIVHAYSSTTMDKLMASSSYAGSGLGLIAICTISVLILLSRRSKLAVWYLMISLSGSAGLNQLLKMTFARTRPSLWVSTLPETSFSFPSGHSMNTMALCAALVIVAWPGKWRGAILACSSIFVMLVGLSRVYWGVHYPSDVIGGWVCGLAWACAVKYAVDSFGQEQQLGERPP